MTAGPIIAVCHGASIDAGATPTASAVVVQTVLDEIKAEGAKNGWTGNSLVEARWTDGDARRPSEILITLEAAAGGDTTVATVRDFITETKLAERQRQAEGRLL